MKKLLVLGFCAGFASSVFAVSMNFNGNFRSAASYYNKLGLGLPTNITKTYLSARALLNPNLVIDDHFSLKSQWSLLTSPTFTPDGTVPLGAGQGGYLLGDPRTAALVLSRAWLEWTSDFGVLRLGRMPISWGYGMVYDAGNGIWDDFQSTYDRFEYRLHLGHVIGALAYSKGRKLSVLGSENDQEFYTAYLQYDNPEMDVEGGILYEKQSRATSQQPDFVSPTTAATSPSPNPYATPGNPYPLSKKTPWPLSSNLVDVYLKKTVSYFTFGGEISWISGNATYNNAIAEQLNAFGVMFSGSYEFHKVKAFLEFLYASGDANLGSNHVNGFVVLNRNRRAGLILGQELLGPYSGNTASQGNMVAYGNDGSFSGVYYFKPGVRIDWTPSLGSGLELIIAQKAAVQPGESSSLGVEIDLGTDYAVYKNFDLGLNLGYLFAGSGLQVASPQGAFAFRTTLSLKF